MALKNKPKAGMKLHKHIALGGSPKTFKGMVGTIQGQKKK